MIIKREKVIYKWLLLIIEKKLLSFVGILKVNVLRLSFLGRFVDWLCDVLRGVLRWLEYIRFFLFINFCWNRVLYVGFTMVFEEFDGCVFMLCVIFFVYCWWGLLVLL